MSSDKSNKVTKLLKHIINFINSIINRIYNNIRYFNVLIEFFDDNSKYFTRFIINLINIRNNKV